MGGLSWEQFHKTNFKVHFEKEDGRIVSKDAHREGITGKVSRLFKSFVKLIISEKKTNYLKMII